MYKAYNGLDGVEDQDSIDMLSEALNDRFIAIDGYKVLPVVICYVHGVPRRI